MNRRFISIVSVLVLGSYLLHAQEEPNMADYLLIDFSTLAPGYQPAPDEIYQRQVDPLPLEEGSDPTVVTFTNAGASLSPEADEAMKDSLALDRWMIDFSPSARWHDSIVDSYVVSYQMRESASLYAGENVLAARIHLSRGQFNTHATIRPPFPIPAYAKEGEGIAANELNTTNDPWGQFLHRGVLRNVGNIRTVSAWIYGRNFPVELRLLLSHTANGKIEIPLGQLDFVGWRKLTWTNPAYIQDVRKRKAADSSHVYPNAVPSLVFDGFKLTRDFNVGGSDAGDLVFYAKSVEVIFDRASFQQATEDVDDEKIWQILSADARQAGQARNEQVSENLERQYFQLQNRIPFPPGDATESDAAPAAPAAAADNPPAAEQ